MFRSSGTDIVKALDPIPAADVRYVEIRYYTSTAPGEITFVDGYEWFVEDSIEWPWWVATYNVCEYQY